MSVDVKYSTRATATGGRDGEARSEDGRFVARLSTPKELGGAGGEGTNPEQLFAAGYSACFIGALKVAGMQLKIKVPAETSATATDDRIRPAVAFRRGLVTNLLNPKAAVFYIAILPDFVRINLGAVRMQTLVLSAIYVGVATIVHLSIVLLAGALQHRIDTADKRRTVRRILALLLVGIAVWFAVSTQR